MKRVVCMILNLALVLTLMSGLAVTSSAAVGIGNFQKSAVYTSGQFSDVAAGAWYAQSVAAAYEYGLVNGKGNGVYSPSGSVTIAETLALACRLHSIYNGGNGKFMQRLPWYQVYVDYAVKNGIIGATEYSDYNAAATREQFASILARSMPKEALSAINQIADGAIPDVSSDTEYGGEIYLLYRAGVLTGNDAAGTFAPKSSIQRSAVAAIVTRMADPTLRQTVTLTKPDPANTTSEQIYAKCSPAVFYIEIYDKNGDATASGSGFFISASGIAVTNYHVIDGAYSAKILRSDTNTVYEVTGVYDYDEKEDWAVIQIKGSGFPYLTFGDSTNLVGGAVVYAIGSPQGLDNTISEGLISNPNRVFSGVPHIQISAPISHGSSGGALLNKEGKVIGVTSSGIEEGENLGFAIPISLVSGYKTGSLTSLKDLASKATYTDQEIAAACLYDFWRKNANDEIGGNKMYSETIETENGYVMYGLYYNSDDDQMVLVRSEDYKGDYYYTFLYLETYETAHFAYYSYYNKGSDDADMRGWGILDAPSFTGENFKFEEITGIYARSVNEEIANDCYLRMLAFLEEILEGYGYTDDAFGFTKV